MRKKRRDRNLPREVAERRADLYEKCESEDQVNWYAQMMLSTRLHGDGLFDPRWNARDFAFRVKQTAAECELFVVTEEMLDLSVHAMKSLEPQVLLPMDLPTPTGFVLFEKPFISVDIRGKKNPVTAIMWREEIIGHIGSAPGIDAHGELVPAVNTGVVLYLFMDNLDKESRPPWLTPQMMANVPRDSLYHLISVSYGYMTWDMVPKDTARGRDELDLWNATRNSMNSLHDGEIISDLGNGVYRIRNSAGQELNVVPEKFVQLMKTVWHFMQSELSEKSREYPPRRTAKGLPNGIPNSPITVVRLRRRKSLNENTGKWSLSYRYLRRGHWRNQWYGSGNSRYQRQIYILPTIVGPDDGPFVDRDVVNLWDR